MTEPNPTVSVVIPCFNASATIASSLESILRQSYTDFEVLWVDDGSTDEGAELAAVYARQDDRVRLQRCEHRGIVGALQHGCAMARGHYIARMDADDVAHPDRLAKQVSLLENEPGLGLCGTQVRTVGEKIGTGRMRYETWINEVITHQDMQREIFIECPIPHPTLMIRKEVFESVGGYQDRGWAEDYDLLMRCHESGLRMGKVPEPLLEWRNHSGRLSALDERYSLPKFRALKRHYLFRSVLKERKSFYQWGAGEVGKAWLTEWGQRSPVAVVDVNPRKIGKVIHEVPVIAASELPPAGEAFTVVAVGAPGAREEIREWFGSHGYSEMLDYLFLA